jgi:hypothetical protein
MARDWTSFALCLVSKRKVDTFASNCLGFVVKPGPFTGKVEDIVMSTSNEIIRAALGIIAFPEKVPDDIVFVGNVVGKMTNNPNFPSPVPTLAAISAAANDLHTAETAALSRTKGAASVRNAKLTLLYGLLKQLLAYVQGVADASPENGAAIIESAGFAVRKVNPRGKRVFAAKPGPIAGTVIVTAAAAGPRSSYEWQYSIDAGKTWVAAPATIQGKTTISGLPSLTTVSFRYLVVTAKGGQGDWSPPTSVLVK